MSASSDERNGVPSSPTPTESSPITGRERDRVTKLTTISSTEDGVDIKFQLGRSGKRSLEYEWLLCMVEVFETFVAKQADYGSENVQRHAERGLAVRMDDKLARLSNLLRSGRPPENETIKETFLDLADYGIIGMIVNQKRWH